MNCFQRVLLPFAGILKMDQELAKRTGTYLGGGLGCGSICGPVIAALLLLGELCGGDSAHAETGKEFLIEFARANGSWLCEDIRDEEHIRCEQAIGFVQEYIERISK